MSRRIFTALFTAALVAAPLSAFCATPPTAAPAKPASAAPASAESFEQFDPQTYGCTSFVQAMETGANSEQVGLALIWAHGYMSSTYGTDEVGPLNEKKIGDLAKEFMTYCKENPKDNFSRAALALTKVDEADAG